MELIPDTGAACFIDGDVMFLTPEYGQIINRYANDHPNAVLICWTNRIHELAKGQRIPTLNEDSRNDIKYMLEHAIAYQRTGYNVTEINGPVSGFLMVVPKSVWKEHRFCEENKFNPGTPNLLGCDNEWTNRIRRNGIKILRMDSFVVWHTYRLLTGSKEHLL